MSSLITLAIYAAMAGGALLFAHHWIETTFVEPEVKTAVSAAVGKQVAADIAILEPVKVERDKWKKQEGDREAENTAMQQVIDKQNEVLAANLKISNARVAASHAIAAQQSATAAAFATDNANLKKIAATAEPARAAADELNLVVPYLNDALGLKAAIDALGLKPAVTK